MHYKLLKFDKYQGPGEVSFGKMPIVPARGLEFRSPAPTWSVGHGSTLEPQCCSVCGYVGVWGSLASQSYQVTELQG